MRVLMSVSFINEHVDERVRMLGDVLLYLSCLLLIMV
jgi:hypothetical protein